MRTDPEHIAYEAWIDQHPLAYPGIEYDAFGAGYRAALASGQYTVADVTEAHAKGYELGLRQVTSQDREDAERYRWLRAGGNDDIGVVRGFDGIDYGSTSVAYTYEEGLDGEQLDAAIDHARRVEGES